MSPDLVLIVTDEERAAPGYESDEIRAWRDRVLVARKWMTDNGTSFERHYTGATACTPSRPTIWTGQYPDVHGVTQTTGIAKHSEDPRIRWLRPGEVPTMGDWFRAAGYDVHYDGKWHCSDADLRDPETHKRIVTNTSKGEVLADGVQAYVDADPLDKFGFSGWVGPEPHGPSLADSGTVRDPLVADRVIAWLEARYAARRAGDNDAMRPFLLCANFVNPHDICLWALWSSTQPLSSDPDDPPFVTEAPTQHESLVDKPAIQTAYKHAYPTLYGPAPMINNLYDNLADPYRRMYYRLHLEVDRQIERVRSTVVAGAGDDEAILLLTSDHGEMLGSHGGLHQKWMNFYDETVRVPLWVASTAGNGPKGRVIDDATTSHIDLLPTLLGLAGIEQNRIEPALRTTHSEVHPLPGRDLSSVVRGDDPDREHGVYMMSRDNVFEGSTTEDLLAQVVPALKSVSLLAIQPPLMTGTNLEAIVTRVESADGGGGRMFKLVRTFDDPDTWTDPGVENRTPRTMGPDDVRTEPLPDAWELYDLEDDPAEAQNLYDDPACDAILAYLKERLAEARRDRVPERNTAWPYMAAQSGAAVPNPSPGEVPGRLARKLLNLVGMHPEYPLPDIDARGTKALVITTSHGWLDIGQPTGVYASEMTAPYYVFADAGMQVDVASIEGGEVPIDPLSLKVPLRGTFDDRFLVDPVLRNKVRHSAAVADLDFREYDIVYLAGGWGASFDFGTSDVLGKKLTQAAEAGAVLGGVCHGPLGFVLATTPEGDPYVKGRRLTSVSDKQIHELHIESTPKHPESELRAAGADYESRQGFRDFFANHIVEDEELITGQNQNAGSEVAYRMMRRLVHDGKLPG